MSKRTSILLPVFFLLLLFCYLVVTSLSRPRVLVVHSYDADFHWVQDVNKAMVGVWHRYPYVRIKHLYLRAQHEQISEKLKTKLRAAEQVIEHWDPQVLLLVDDIAQKTLGQRYLNHPNIKMVFTGVSEKPQVYGYPGKNVTGVVQYPQVEGMKQTIEAVFPQVKNLLIVGDSTVTSHAVMPHFKRFNWGKLKVTQFLLSNDFAKWQEAIRVLSPNDSAVIVLGYFTLHYGQQPIKGATAWRWLMDNARLPVIGSYVTSVEDGGELAVTNSIYNQGNAAARLVMQSLALRPGEPMPAIQYPQTFSLELNRKIFKRRHPTTKLPPIFLSLVSG